MTAAIMLIGAWLLIHHQCCASGQNEKSRGSHLIDQLSRRSNLEKNFMRFGRSPSVSIDEGRQSMSARGGRGADFMRFGRSLTMREGGAKRGIPIRSGRDVDFIRFGRSLPVIEREENLMDTNSDFGQFSDRSSLGGEGDEKLGGFERGEEYRFQHGQTPSNKENHDNHSLNLSSNDKIQTIEERSGKNSNFMRFGRLSSTEEDNLPQGNDVDFMRFGWSPEEKRRGQDFMRFGRISGQEFMEDKRRGSDFMRFGRIPGKVFMEDKRRGSDFMRFGRTPESEFMEDKRRGSDFMRFGRTSGAKFIENKRRGSDFMRFGRIPGTSSMEDKRGGSDFMRFGRTQGTELIEDKRRGSDFMRFGRSLLSLEGEEKLEISGEASREANKGNSHKVGFQVGVKKGEENTIGFGPQAAEGKERELKIKPNSNNFAQGIVKNGQPADFLAIQERARNDFMRFGRFPALQLDPPHHRIDTRAGRPIDFMRFGRSQALMGNDEKRTRQDFMRFGRAHAMGEVKGINARSGNKAGFIRFGRGYGDVLKRGLEGRSNSGFIRFGRAERLGQFERDDEGTQQVEDLTRFGRALPSPFQPGFILGPELSFLPALSLPHTHRSSRSDFMRFPG